MTLSRSFKIALLISAATHAGAFVALDQEPVAEKLLAAPRAVVAKRPEPRSVRFELVDTPASAEAPEPPKNSALVSNKNTRAQDRFKGDKKLEDTPRIEGEKNESKDTRPRAVIARPAPPARQPEPAPPKVRPAPKRDPAEKAKEIKAKEPARKELVKREEEPLRQIPAREKPAKPAESIAPKPEEKEVIRLAKKIPAQARLAPPTPTRPKARPRPLPRMGAGVSAGAMGGDAEITGEISFGATRHFFGDYLLKMKQAVETEWMSSLVSQYTGIERSTAAIDFKIQPDGQVTDLEVVSNEGDPYFPLVCISSIQSAQPFDEIRYAEIQGLPEEFVDRPLSVRFTFRYN